MIVLAGPPVPVATDGVIHYGIKGLLEKALGPDQNYVYVTIPNHGPLVSQTVHDAVGLDIQSYGCKAQPQRPMSEHVERSEVDLLVVCGSPWLWYHMGHSDKYRNFIELRDRLKPKRIWFCGIGACLPIDERPAITAAHVNAFTDDYGPEHRAAIREIMGADNTWVTVRDPLALSLMLWALSPDDPNASPIAAAPGISPGCERLNLAVCPSAFALDYWLGSLTPSELAELRSTAQNRSSSAMFFYAPELGVSSSAFRRVHRIKENRKIFRDWYNQRCDATSRPDVYVADQIEMAPAYDEGYEHVELLRDEFDTFRAIVGRSNVISGRVHCAIPAAAHADTVNLIKVDTRGGTADFFRAVGGQYQGFAQHEQLYLEQFRGLMGQEKFAQ